MFRFNNFVRHNKLSGGKCCSAFLAYATLYLSHGYDHRTGRRISSVIFYTVHTVLSYYYEVADDWDLR